jgi:hypothetical protein
MTSKVILLHGVSNTGKTRSIKTYAELEGLFVLQQRGDITLVMPTARGRRKLKVGIASGGDNAKIVRQNFDFFRRHRPDVIVCASRTRGQTKQIVEQRARSLGASLVTFEIKREPQNRVAKKIRRIARQIWRAV